MHDNINSKEWTSLRLVGLWAGQPVVQDVLRDQMYGR